MDIPQYWDNSGILRGAVRGIGGHWTIDPKYPLEVGSQRIKRLQEYCGNVENNL